MTLHIIPSKEIQTEKKEKKKTKEKTTSLNILLIGLLLFPQFSN